MKRKHALALALAIGAAFAAQSGGAADKVSPKEAEAMVKKGVAFIKANGKEKPTRKSPASSARLTDRDLYLVVYRLDGTALADGANEKMVGWNLIDLKDIDGKEFVRERVEMAKAKTSFGQDYKFTNPVSKKVEAKTMYCERLEDTAVCGGIYK